MFSDAEPLLDGEDIQGNILPGFNRLERYLVAFTCSDGERLQKILSSWVRNLQRWLKSLNIVMTGSWLFEEWSNSPAI